MKSPEHVKLIVEYAGKLRRDTPDYTIVEFGHLVDGTLDEVREEAYNQGFKDAMIKYRKD